MLVPSPVTENPLEAGFDAGLSFDSVLGVLKLKPTFFSPLAIPENIVELPPPKLMVCCAVFGTDLVKLNAGGCVGSCLLKLNPPLAPPAS